VTVADVAGRQVARRVRDKLAFTLYGPGDVELANLECDGDGPWPVCDGAGELLGELPTGEPGPSLSPELWQ
jgi:hypothetical protein